MDLLCIDFTKVDLSKDSKENILVLTDAFTTFRQVFITPNQKMLTVAKILVDKGFYVYGIPTQTHSNQCQCFEHKILKCLYAIYSVKQSPTTLYNLCGNVNCERFNGTVMDMFKSLTKE